MRKALIWMLVTVFMLTFTVIGVGCKKEAAPAEEEAEEIEVPTEEITLSMWMQDWPGGIKFVGGFNDYFMEKYPNIKIEWELISWLDLGQKILPAVMTGEEPDIIFGYGEWLTGQDVSQLFLKLTPDAFTKEELTNIIYPEALEPDSVRGSDGEIYGVPWRMGPDHDLITVNKDLADAAGVDVTQIKTWDDMIEASKKMTQYNDDGSIKVSGMSLDNYWHLTQWYIELVREQGGNPYDKATGTWNFDTPEGIKAIELLDSFVEEKIWDPASGSAMDGLPKGICASFFIGPWYTTYIWETYPELNITHYIRPSSTDKVIKQVPSIQMMSFSKRVEGAERDAVLLYTRELIQPKFMEFYATGDPGIGVILNKAFVENYKAGEYEGVWEDEKLANLVALSVQETERYLPAMEPIGNKTNFDEWAALMTPEFQKVFLEDGSYEDFVKAVSDALTKAEQEKL